MNLLPLCPTYKVVIAQSTASLIRRGKFSWINPGINAKSFKSKQFVVCNVELVLAQLNESASTEQVLIELDRHGLRPARFEELLALAVMHPELQSKFRIVALGSKARRSRRGEVPFICEGEHGRALDEGYYKDWWHTSYRFLAAAK